MLPETGFYETITVFFLAVQQGFFYRLKNPELPATNLLHDTSLPPKWGARTRK
ncbi:hypothetical protein FC25_GL002050 [Ligilactobacillus ruminis DSM 20403 = NBRC 102161]|nr:hypothetical protein FC25_GL002050 [Ligilactobacillus ruminis DSM 20403 = NBRC 102161]